MFFSLGRPTSQFESAHRRCPQWTVRRPAASRSSASHLAVRARISRRSQPSILPTAARRLANRVIGTPCTLYELRTAVGARSRSRVARPRSPACSLTTRTHGTRGATTVDARLEASSRVTSRKHGTNIHAQRAQHSNMQQKRAARAETTATAAWPLTQTRTHNSQAQERHTRSPHTTAVYSAVL